MLLMFPVWVWKLRSMPPFDQLLAVASCSASGRIPAAEAALLERLLSITVLGCYFVKNNSHYCGSNTSLRFDCLISSIGE